MRSSPLRPPRRAPRRALSALLSWLACAASVACGGASLQTGRTVPTLVTVGGGQRAIVTYTDLDDVRDVAPSGERLWVATDRGVLVHALAAEGEPTRLLRSDGLPSNDVTAVVVLPDGSAVVATSEGLARISADLSATSIAVEPLPAVGRVSDLHHQEDGTLWACGVGGVARTQNGGWARFGEDATCVGLVPDGAALWVLTTAGLWRIEGDVVREHGITRGIPEGHARGLVPLGDGKALALLQGPGDTKIGYWDGERWYAYALGELQAPAVGLGRVGGKILLFVPGQAFEIAIDEAGAGVPLTPIARSDLRTVRSYRGRLAPTADVAGPAQERSSHREPSALAEVPPDLPTIAAPAFSISSSAVQVPAGLYGVITAGDAVFLADRNRGVSRAAAMGAPTTYRSRELVDALDLQVANDAAGNVWVMGRGDTLGLLRGERIERAQVPEGVTAQCLTSGPSGAYVLATVDGPSAEPAAGTTVRLYRVSTDGFTPELEKVLVTATRLVSIPFCAIGADFTVWAGLRVAHESGEGTRMRGAAVFGRGAEPVVYFHRGATAQTDGPTALAMPDEIDGVDLGMEGYAWFPSLSGAIRVGNSQAVVFGEARGVRGEVVTDVVVGENDRVWLAAAEGVGYYENQTFEFRLPAVVQQARPNRLALDAGGHVWGAGPNGVVYFDGASWQTLTRERGLPTQELVDVEVDGQDRVWLLGRDRVLVFSPVQAAAAQTP